MTSTTTEPVITCADGRWRGDWSDGYAVIIKELDTARVGACRTELEVQYQGTYVTTLAVDLLSARSREEFTVALGARNGVPPATWDDRLGKFYRNFQDAQAQTTEQSPWTQALTADEFLNQKEAELSATVRDMVMPGMITLISAHRGSGKTMVALSLGIALAKGRVFRSERLTQQRVFVIDRDNPPALIRSRMRHLGAKGATNLRVLTRDKAPSLTERDRSKWEQFPVEDYDVVLMDSISAFTEGVSEREGKETQEWLSILKDLAMRGPAIIGLANTNKTGVNIRGRGEITAAVDIVYECRNITGWLPTKGGDWVAELPERGEHTWQEAAAQQREHKGTLLIAFVATKFRFGATPEPFVLELDTRQMPWSLADVTARIASAGEQAAVDARAAERQRLGQAALALVRYIREQHLETVLKMAAETFLRSHGLTARQANALLEDGYNADRHPTVGLWYLRPIPGRKGGAIGVTLVETDASRAKCEDNDVTKNDVDKYSQKNMPFSNSISYTRIPSGVENTAATEAKK